VLRAFLETGTLSRFDSTDGHRLHFGQSKLLVMKRRQNGDQSDYVVRIRGRLVRIFHLAYTVYVCARSSRYFCADG
jgi:hypothetical protein